MKEIQENVNVKNLKGWEHGFKLDSGRKGQMGEPGIYEVGGEQSMDGKGRPVNSGVKKKLGDQRGAQGRTTAKKKASKGAH